jgi:hypothetical protein
MQAIFGLLLILALIYIYCVPAIVAEKRKHPQRAGISVLNFFLGWTFIGWVVALVWAVSEPVKKSA